MTDAAARNYITGQWLDMASLAEWFCIILSCDKFLGRYNIWFCYFSKCFILFSYVQLPILVHHRITAAASPPVDLVQRYKAVTSTWPHFSGFGPDPLSRLPRRTVASIDGFHS